MAVFSAKIPGLSAKVAAAILLASVPVRPASADYISSGLGAAGGWSVLGVGSTGNLTMSGASVVGDIGVSSGNFTLTGSTINGSTDLGTGVTFTRTGGSLGGINRGVDLSAAVGAATNASSAFSALPITPGGPTSIVMTGGNTTLDPGVYDLSQLRLTGGSLTLSGSGEYIINVSGPMTVTGGQMVLTNGASAADVVFNVTGTQAVQISGGVLDGTILAPNASITMTSGSVGGEIIGGKNITLTSGQVVGAPRGAPGPVIGAGLPAFVLLGGGFLLAWRLRRRPLTASASL
jgi:choice-of-anchor A domain-containing protein